MSRHIYALLFIAATVSVNGALADEVSKSTSVESDGPNYSSSSSTTTREDSPTTITRESTTNESSPYAQEVTTKKTYRTAPQPSRRTTIHKETNVVR